MELTDQHTKKIMEDCKDRARAAGLLFDDESLEYIVANRDLNWLSPKIMIPTLYDYWVHDVEVWQGEGRYKLYPSNPYETVINTRPAISFYNDNNPDWLNVMIFYHVLGHIDCFQNNVMFENTWNDDFCGQALADKRMIARLREDMGGDKRWVDYVIEFARGLDNLVGYYSELNSMELRQASHISSRLNYYLGDFLREIAKYTTRKYLDEIDRYNEYVRDHGETTGEKIFFEDVAKKHPEFTKYFEKHGKEKKVKTNDLLQYIIEHSKTLNKPKNEWMKSVIQIVRNTSLYFQPQIRTKILNEGWASYWHQKLYMADDRIGGHEVSFARINAGVMQMPRVGLNPYALGYRLLEFIYDLAEKGKLTHDYLRLQDIEERKNYDTKAGLGAKFLFHIRKNFNDFMLINFLDDRDLQDFVDRHKLFVAGRRLAMNPVTYEMVWQWYVKSRSAKDYRKMLNDSLYHPPHITIREDKTNSRNLYLNHHFEGKPLVTEYIANTMMGTEFLWGGTVWLETTEMEVDPRDYWYYLYGWIDESEVKIERKRVLYKMHKRKLTRQEI